MKQNIDEIWREYAEKEQEWYRNRLKIFREHVRKLRKLKLGRVHYKLLRLAGPEWYQELSLKQLEIVDYFQFCIIKDLEEGTLINCQQNLIDLGVLPKCHRKHLKLALNNCNECPVEFLLILYQSINPKRENYSLNDRLLLSAVVHLTMRQTLKELHVRIPSPPKKPPQTIRVKQKKTKRVDYKSPYLVPFTFKPQPRKHGIYANRHIQYPESPYFDYRVNLNKCDEYETPILSRTDIEIEDELEEAQSFYENLVDFRPVPRLLKPRVYRYDIEIMDEVSGNDLVPFETEIEEEEQEEEIEEEQEKEEPSCDCLEKYLTKIKEYETKMKRLQLIEKLETNKTKYIIGGIIDTPNGPECLINGRIPRRIPPDCTCMDLYNSYINEHSNCMKIYDKYLEDMKYSLDEYTEEIVEEKENTDVPLDDEGCQCHNSETFQVISTKQSNESFDEEECNEEFIMNNSNTREQVQKATVFKRFFIYKNLPCKPRKQQTIIKDALNSMANDGFPLAKLPKSYQLPHFKLWMQMRCGKYWTQDDRRRYLQKNVSLWNHTDNCKRAKPKFNLGIDQKKAQNLTWQHADYCRKIVNDAKNLYCKRLKETVIDMGREFFPTTFLYEFPSKRFREIYFAYVPTKEAELIGKYVWLETEIKDFSKRKIGQ